MVSYILAYLPSQIDPRSKRFWDVLHDGGLEELPQVRIEE